MLGLRRRCVRCWDCSLDMLADCFGYCESCVDTSVRVAGTYALRSPRAALSPAASAPDPGPVYVLLGFTLILARTPAAVPPWPSWRSSPPPRSTSQGVITVYFRVLLPLMFDLRTAGGLAHSAAGLWLSSNILFNYALCVRTPPGAPPDLLDAVEAPPERAGGGGGGRRQRWCRRCSNAKPQLCHHCSVCKRCVLKMDHHCPWMNSCGRASQAR